MAVRPNYAEAESNANLFASRPDLDIHTARINPPRIPEQGTTFRHHLQIRLKHIFKDNLAVDHYGHRSRKVHKMTVKIDPYPAG